MELLELCVGETARVFVEQFTRCCLRREVHRIASNTGLCSTTDAAQRINDNDMIMAARHVFTLRPAAILQARLFIY